MLSINCVWFITIPAKNGLYFTILRLFSTLAKFPSVNNFFCLQYGMEGVYGNIKNIWSMWNFRKIKEQQVSNLKTLRDQFANFEK
jgi:hypothetical protein